jgi:hypothetical protein
MVSVCAGFATVGVLACGVPCQHACTEGVAVDGVVAPLVGCATRSVCLASALLASTLRHHLGAAWGGARLQGVWHSLEPFAAIE